MTTGRTRLILFLCLAPLLLALAGCGGPVVVDPDGLETLTPPPGMGAGAGVATAPVYRIAPGNTLDVKFYYTPELNERVIVRPDGRISLQLVQDIEAAGMTTDDLARELRLRYSGELIDPEIAVIVSENRPRVFIDGQVERPGMLELTGPTTVTQSIATAGGFTDEARLETVLLIRRPGPPDARPLVVPLDLAAFLNGSARDQDPALVDFDIVYVPRSAIANVNLWVDQYIRRNIPSPFTPLLAPR